MCGFAGFVDRTGRWSPENLSASARAMAATLAHRGPDSAGDWVDAAAGVAIGHRRLAFLELSDKGHQPMVSPSGRYVIAYNGEVYNFRELRAELEAAGDRFRGHSDTEVVLAAIERWGLAAALARFVGMFAFA
ncbi:MAG: asparagine synthetase B, partial [Alphaproteobacteria bacterium]|nr:asparagine synthetase B [Alphaproteobacteria bacterium]